MLTVLGCWVGRQKLGCHCCNLDLQSPSVDHMDRVFVHGFMKRTGLAQSLIATWQLLRLLAWVIVGAAGGNLCHSGTESRWNDKEMIDLDGKCGSLAVNINCTKYCNFASNYNNLERFYPRHKIFCCM